MSVNMVLVNTYDSKRFLGSNVYVYDKQEIPVEHMLSVVLDYIKNNPRATFNHLISYDRVNPLAPNHLRVFGRDDVEHEDTGAPKFIISIVFFGGTIDDADELVTVLLTKIDETMTACAAEAERKSKEIHEQKIKALRLERYKNYLRLKDEFES